MSRIALSTKGAKRNRPSGPNSWVMRDYLCWSLPLAAKMRSCSWGVRERS